MSSASASTSNNSNISSSTYRVNYSEYVSDITGSPKATRKITTTTSAHHNSPLNNLYPNRSNQPIQQTGVMPQYGGGTDKCARCLKNVYLAEKKVGAGRAFHSSCFNCYTCKRKLDAATLSEHKGEIYCKSCYTKQFGPHGLAGGVSMSTETALLRESRSRRSSFGNDLDPITIIHSQTRPRATSSENILREEYGTKKNDEFSQRYPQRYDGSPEQNSASSRKTSGIEAIVDTKRDGSRSPSSNEKVTVPKTNTDSHRSIYGGEDDRSKYIHEGERLSYGSASSAFVNVPVVTIPKQSDATVHQVNIPIEPSRDDRQSRNRSPSPPSNERVTAPKKNIDSHRSIYGGEDDRSKYIHEGEKLSYGSASSTFVNVPVVTIPKQPDSTVHQVNFPIEPIRNDQRSRSRSPSVTSNDSYRRQHSRERQTDITDDFPHLYLNTDNNRVNRQYSYENTTNPIASPMPTITGNYYHSSASHESRYTSTTTSAVINDRRSPSPRNDTHRSSALNDFISRTNVTGSTSPATKKKYSALESLVANTSPFTTRNYDDDFDN